VTNQIVSCLEYRAKTLYLRQDTCLEIFYIHPPRHTLRHNLRHPLYMPLLARTRKQLLPFLAIFFLVFSPGSRKGLAATKRGHPFFLSIKQMEKVIVRNQQFEHWEKRCSRVCQYRAQMSASTPPLIAVSTLNISISTFFSALIDTFLNSGLDGFSSF
jgi:hypothetical protein